MGKYGSFRAKSWDPLLLTAQIIAVQSSLYFTLGIIMYFMDFLGGRNNSIDHIFIYQKIKVSDSEGRLVIFAYLINALVGSLVLLFLVKRTKLCLDFSCTFHLIHLIVCIFYNGATWPTITTWLVWVVSASIMTLGGEYLCLAREMREIPVGYQPVCNGNNRIDL